MHCITSKSVPVSLVIYFSQISQPGQFVEWSLNMIEFLRFTFTFGFVKCESFQVLWVCWVELRALDQQSGSRNFNPQAVDP